MRHVVVVLYCFFTLVVGCSSGSSLPIQGDAGLDGGSDSSTTSLDASPDGDPFPDGDAEIQARCDPPSKPRFTCVADSDCPAPAPPQYLKSYCCGTIVGANPPGVCRLSLSNTTCVFGGCGGASLECDAMGSSVGPQHMCNRAADCAGSELCCSSCGGGLAISICMSSTDATKYGAKCL